MRVTLKASWYDEDVAALKDTSEMVTEPVSRVKVNPRPPGARIR